MTEFAPFVQLENDRVHPFIELEDLRSFYSRPGEKHAEVDGGPDGDTITSPWDSHRWDHYRRKHGLKSGEAMPTDNFVWAKGVAPDPGMTKVGGLPQLPKVFEWPLARPRIAVEELGDRERPMEFVAQFNLEDSRDLVPDDLPGDILLVFIRRGGWIYDEKDLLVNFVVP